MQSQRNTNLFVDIMHRAKLKEARAHVRVEAICADPRGMQPPAAARPTIDMLRRFVPRGEKDSFLTVALPPYAWHSIESLVSLAGGHTSVTSAAFWLVSLGLPKLHALEDVQKICEVRAAFRQTDHPDTVRLDGWTFKVRGPRHTYRRAEPGDVVECERLVKDLGLSKPTVAGLAALYGLVAAPLPAQSDTPRRILLQLELFAEELRDQASEAAHVQRTAKVQPLQQTVTYEDADALFAAKTVKDY